MQKEMALSKLASRRSFLLLNNLHQVRAASTFANVPLGPPDPIFGLTDAFNKVIIYVTHTWVTVVYTIIYLTLMIFTCPFDHFRFEKLGYIAQESEFGRRCLP